MVASGGVQDSKEKRKLIESESLASSFGWVQSKPGDWSRINRSIRTDIFGIPHVQIRTSGGVISLSAEDSVLAACGRRSHASEAPLRSRIEASVGCCTWPARRPSESNTTKSAAAATAGPCV